MFDFLSEYRNRENATKRSVFAHLWSDKFLFGRNKQFCVFTPEIE